MAIIQTIPLGKKYGSMTLSEAQAGTNTESQLISAKVLNDQIDEKISDIGLATVATSGSYNDLNDKPTIPTIPTVNNGTLTIQQNGENVKTFTANSSSNVTANITVPTKTSELTNDTDYATRTNVTNSLQEAKNYTDTTTNNMATTYATKLYVDNEISGIVNTAPETLDTLNELASALGNDPNFATTIATQIGTKADNASVVHTTGDETIEGVKTFTGSPFVSNYATTNGYFTQINLVARNEVPSQIYHSAFRVFDKNAKTLGEYCVEKSTSGSSLLHMDVHAEDAKGNDIMESLYLNLSNDGSTVSFHPGINNRTDLGMLNFKWAGVYASNFYGNATSATKATQDGDGKVISTTYATKLYVDSANSNMVTTNTTQTITGSKSFSGYLDYLVPLNQSEIPTINTYKNFRYLGNDGLSLFSLQYCSRTNESRDATLYVYDKDGGSHGLRISTNNDVSPVISNAVTLGTSSNKWLAAYATNFYGDLIGNATTATKATNDANGNVISTTYATKSENALKANDASVVHTTGDETIDGVKSFNNTIYTYSDILIKNNSIDLTVTPSTSIYNNYLFNDKNNRAIACVQYSQQTGGADYIGLKIRDKNYTFFGVQLNTNKEFIPVGINSYSLGSSSYKWASVYATNFYGNLVGNAATATSATKATQDGAGNVISTTYATKSENSTKANDADVVHLANTESITGLKYFTTDICNKNENTVVTETPTTNQYIRYRFIDKNNDLLASIQYANRTSGVRNLAFYLNEASGSTVGVLLNTDKSFNPLSDNSYSLGTSSNKWLNVYATTVNTSILNIPQNAIVLAFCSSAVNNGSTVAGTSLKVANGSTGGSFTATTEILTGTYRALNTVVANGVGMFVKIA